MRFSGSIVLSTSTFVWVITSLILDSFYLSKGFTTAPTKRTGSTSIGSRKILLGSSSSMEDKDNANDNNSNNLPSSTSNQNIILISFDGAIADTSSWRSNLAIDVAYSTWCSKDQDIDGDVFKKYQLDNPSTDRSWVINRINALMQNLLSDQHGLINCDAVLLTRLILEEQLLDQGRSIGKTGKYASKYHPNVDVDVAVAASAVASDTSSREEEEEEEDDGIQQTGNQGSRPLTVGEIEANWSKGACLKDTVRVKYNIGGKDPIPIISENICKILAQQDSDETTNLDLPILNEEVVLALSERSRTQNWAIYVMVGHESHLHTASKTLEQGLIPHEIIPSLDQLSSSLSSTSKSSDKHVNSSQDIKLFLVAPGEGGRDHIGILQQMIMSSQIGASIHFIHPIVEKLQQARLMYGDNRPTLAGFGTCAIKRDVNLKLSMPSWASCCGMKQQNDVLMQAPWLNLLDKSKIIKTDQNPVV